MTRQRRYTTERRRANAASFQSGGTSRLPGQDERATAHTNAPVQNADTSPAQDKRDPPQETATREQKPRVAEPVSQQPPSPLPAKPAPTRQGRAEARPSGVVDIAPLRARKERLARVEAKRPPGRRRIYPRKCPPSIKLNYNWTSPTKKAGWSLYWRKQAQGKRDVKYICYLRYDEWDAVKFAYKSKQERIAALTRIVARKLQNKKQSAKLTLSEAKGLTQ